MSMYNMLEGCHPEAKTLLDIIGLKIEEIARFRDIWITQDGKVELYTRTGGGNDECNCDWMDHDELWEKITNPKVIESMKKNGELVLFRDRLHFQDCYWVYNRKLEGKPNFISFKYDEGDETYAHFLFSPVEGKERLLKLIMSNQPEKYKYTPHERFMAMLDDISGLTPEQLKKTYPQIAEVSESIKKTLEE